MTKNSNLHQTTNNTTKHDNDNEQIHLRLQPDFLNFLLLKNGILSTPLISAVAFITKASYHHRARESTEILSFL